MVVNVQGQSCGVIGTDAGGVEAYSQPNFYLNTQDPAPCSGTIDEFQYCYYDTQIARSYGFTFAVFRETSMGEYTKVSEAYTAVRGFNLHDSFACLSFPVMNQIQIQAGDMIGACVYNSPGILRLETYVVGEGVDPERFLMVASNSGCGDSTVPSPVSSLSKVESLVLHISATISEYTTPY